MPRAGWTGCRGRGATCGAAWAWCRSFSATSPARRGRVVAAGVPVARILPGEGVELESGERIPSPQRGLQRRPESDARARSASRRGPGVGRGGCGTIPIEGVTVKVNMTLTELPNFTARPGTMEPHHTGQVEHAALEGRVARVSPGRQRGCAAAADLERALPPDGVRSRRGAARGRTRSACSRSTCPNRFTEGHWDTRRRR